MIGAADDDFIDERIEHAAEDGDLSVAAGPKAIEPIGAGGEEEQPKAGPIPMEGERHCKSSTTNSTIDSAKRTVVTWLGKLTMVRSSYFAERALEGGW